MNNNKKTDPTPNRRSKLGTRIKLFVMFFTLIAFVVLTALVFILRVHDKPLIFAAIDYVRGVKVTVKEKVQADEGVLNLFNTAVKDITSFDKKTEDLTAELQGLNDIKKIEEFISAVRVEKNNVVKVRNRILGIKRECDGRELDNLSTADIEAAIENSKTKEGNLHKVEDAAYAKMAELQKKSQETGTDMIVTRKPEPKPEEINIVMKCDVSTNTVMTQVNAKAANNKEELEGLLRSALEEAKKSGKDVIAIIDADSAVPEQEITDVTNICKKVQIEKINFRKEKSQ